MTGPDLRKKFLSAVLVLEEVVESGISIAAQVGGRRHPLIVPFIGHGTPTRARIGARLVRGRRDAESVEPPPTEMSSPRSRRSTLKVGLARFLTVEITRTEVTIHGPAGDEVVRTDREGYVDHEIDLAGVEPGWLDVPLSGPGGASAVAKVLIVDPATDVGIVSDIDDTILHTGLTRVRDFLRATLLTDVTERTPLPGAAALYRALVAPGRPVFYVSTSPWNLHEMLLQFVRLRGFPIGPLLLTDWGPSHTGLFRIGASQHKAPLIRRLLDEHPGLRFVLIGDSGQEDPEIYASIARDHPDRIAAIYIRRITGVDLGRGEQTDELAAEIRATGVPMLIVDDSAQIAAHAAELELLDAAAVSALLPELRSP